MPTINYAIPWIMLGVLVAIMVVRWVYLVKSRGQAGRKPLDLRLTLIRVLIILGAILAVVMGVWTIPQGRL